MTSGQPLCPEHLGQRERLGVSIADFTARPDVIALPSHGTCSVASCPRQLPGHDAVYCDAHLQRLRVLRRAGHHPDEAAWRATEPPVPRAGQVSLAGLAPAAAVEVLFGLQQRTRQGVKTYCTILRPVANDARTQQVLSLAGLDIPASRGQGYASVVHTLITHARRGISDPGTEIAKDTWDMALFGHRGNLSFTAITQPWLRETAKIWALAGIVPPPRAQRRGQDPALPVEPGPAVGQPAAAREPAARTRQCWHSSSDGGAPKGRSPVRRSASGRSPSLIPPMARQHGSWDMSAASAPRGSGCARAPPGSVSRTSPSSWLPIRPEPAARNWTGPPALCRTQPMATAPWPLPLAPTPAW